MVENLLCGNRNTIGNESGGCVCVCVYKLRISRAGQRKHSIHHRTQDTNNFPLKKRHFNWVIYAEPIQFVNEAIRKIALRAIVSYTQYMQSVWMPLFVVAYRTISLQSNLYSISNVQLDSTGFVEVAVYWKYQRLNLMKKRKSNKYSMRHENCSNFRAHISFWPPFS